MASGVRPYTVGVYPPKHARFSKVIRATAVAPNVHTHLCASARAWYVLSYHPPSVPPLISIRLRDVHTRDVN